MCLQQLLPSGRCRLPEKRVAQLVTTEQTLTLFYKLRVLVREIFVYDKIYDSFSLLNVLKDDCHVSMEFQDLTS